MINAPTDSQILIMPIGQTVITTIANVDVSDQQNPKSFILMIKSSSDGLTWNDECSCFWHGPEILYAPVGVETNAIAGMSYKSTLTPLNGDTINVQFTLQSGTASGFVSVNQGPI